MKFVNFKNYWKRRRLIQLTFMSTVVLTIEEAITQGLQYKYGSEEWVQGKRISLPYAISIKSFQI